VAKPDGSHDQLPPEQAAAVEQILRREGLWTEPEVRKEAGVLRLLFAGVAAAGMVIAAGMLVLWVDMRHQDAIRDNQPLPTFVVPADGTPTVTPFPSGWVPR
jgi:hypothetical protein